MKTTFKANEIAHVWMHQSAPRGKSSNALSFRGEVILSYNTAIGRIVTHKGKVGVIFNQGKFSVTTTRHQNMMSAAIPGDTPVFYFQENKWTQLDVSPERLFLYAIEKAARCKIESASARGGMKQNMLLAEQGVWLGRAKKVSVFFGLRKKVDEKTMGRLSDIKAAKEKKESAEKEKLRKKTEDLYLAAYESWKQGGNEYFNPGLFEVAFRVENNELVSSLGARVRLEDARHAYRFIMLMRSGKSSQNEAKCRVGNYSIDAIAEAGVVAGCHIITYEEIDRLASVLG